MREIITGCHSDSTETRTDWWQGEEDALEKLRSGKFDVIISIQTMTDAAISSRQHILPPQQPCVTQQTLGHQARMFNNVRAMAYYPGHE